MHYYKFNISDWVSGTAHLTLIEEAVYFRLVNHYYDTESPIPLETHSVSRRLRMADQSETVAEILNEFFTKTEKGYTHERCDELLKEYKKTVNKNRKNAAKGGRPSKNAASKETQSVSSGNPVGSQKEPDGIPNQEPLTNNQEPLTTNKDIGDKSPAKAKRFTPPELLEAIDYFFERTQDKTRSVSEAQRFVDFYESKGWYVGKNKMKDWKAAVRNWLNKNNNQRMTPAQKTQMNIMDFDL